MLTLEYVVFSTDRWKCASQRQPQSRCYSPRQPRGSYSTRLTLRSSLVPGPLSRDKRDSRISLLMIMPVPVTELSDDIPAIRMARRDPFMLSGMLLLEDYGRRVRQMIEDQHGEEGDKEGRQHPRRALKCPGLAVIELDERKQAEADAEEEVEGGAGVVPRRPALCARRDEEQVHEYQGQPRGYEGVGELCSGSLV
jgi:hypothetical protein